MTEAGLRIAVAGAESGVETAPLGRRAGGWRRLLALDRRGLGRLGAPPAFVEALLRACRMDVGRYRGGLAARGIHCAGFDELGYPPALLELADPPAAVYMIGATDLLFAAAGLAIVGSRRPAEFTRRLAHDLAQFCAGREITVVSGLALGIDAAAHAGALDGGGATIAVLGGGVDVVYPRANRRLYEQVAERGLVLSEYPPGTGVAPWRFPARNRLIAALARGALVVEARARSGALITADHALDLGREVLAVPGSPATAGAAGTNGLLKAGAGMIEDATDLAGWLGVEPPEVTPVLVEAGPAAVLAMLADSAGTPDELADRLGWTARDVSTAVVRLELGGLVVRDGVGRLTAHRPG